MARTQPLPPKKGQGDRVKGLIEGREPGEVELDLDMLRPNSSQDRLRMEQAVSRPTATTPAAQETSAVAASRGGVGHQVASSTAGLRVGETYELPVNLLKDSPYNARVWYSPEDVDVISVSMQQNGQDVAAVGYVDESGKVVLIDGSKRLRAAKSGGVETLRVEIKPKPASERELYLASRRMNVERSQQTPFDDSVRFKTLLDEGLYSSQAELAKDVGLSQSMVSYTLSLTKLPPSVIKVLREERTKKGEAKLCQIAYAQEFAKMFDGTGVEGHELEDTAIEIARDVLAKDLSVRQTQDLIRSRMEGKRQRAQADKIALKYGNGAGTLKVFASKGQIDLSIKGVEPSKIEELRLKIEALFVKA